MTTDTNIKSALGLLSKGVVIAGVVLALACQRESRAVNHEQPAAVKSVPIENIHVDARPSGLIVHYRTATSVRDCNAQSSEMPRVWYQVVAERLKSSDVPAVTLFPEDSSGQSVGMTFTKRPSEQWSASAPCSIDIPKKIEPK